MVADGLLHGAFEGLVRGGDRQEEAFGAQLPLRKEPFVPPPFSSSRQRMEEGEAGRGEEAGGGGLFGSCGKVKEVLQGDGAPSS